MPLKVGSIVRRKRRDRTSAYGMVIALEILHCHVKWGVGRKITRIKRSSLVVEEGKL